MVVRREDGFEVRGLYRCRRCDVCVGYVVEGEGGDVRAEGEIEILYLLPGGVVSTSFMAGGRKLTEGEVEVAGGNAVAAWE